MGQFLLWSLIASIGLTILLNLALALFPDRLDRAEQRLAQMASPDETRSQDASSPNSRRKMRIVFPIKLMVVGSLLLTLLFNLGAVIAS